MSSNDAFIAYMILSGHTPCNVAYINHIYWNCADAITRLRACLRSC